MNTNTLIFYFSNGLLTDYFLEWLEGIRSDEYFSIETTQKRRFNVVIDQHAGDVFFDSDVLLITKV